MTRKKTLSGLEPSTFQDKSDDINLSSPGNYPYTRGIYPSMYQSRVWTMRQYSGFSTAKETNERFKLLLEKGQTGLSVAFDLTVYSIPSVKLILIES